jgi:hypothetical protein
MTETSDSTVLEVAQFTVATGAVTLLLWRLLKSIERQRVITEQKKEVKR